MIMYAIKTDQGYSSVILAIMTKGHIIESPSPITMALYDSIEVAEQDLRRWHETGRTDARIVELNITETELETSKKVSLFGG